MKLGVAVDNLGGSQLNYFLIKNANAALFNDPTLDVVVFFQDQVQPCLPCNFAVMPLHEAYGHDGVVVATTFTSAGKLARFPGPRKKFFYVWDLEWTRPHGPRHFTEAAAVYRDPSLGLIARGVDHARLIESCWNREVAGVVEDMDFARMVGVVGAH